VEKDDWRAFAELDICHALSVNLTGLLGQFVGI
jgi:hypothetical protein